MPVELSYDQALRHVETGRLLPVYLLFGTGEFLKESFLDGIRATCVDEGTRELNLRVFYGEKDGIAGEILDFARSMPFMATRRLAIVRRAGDLKAEALEALVPYLENPSPTTSVFFVASSLDFRKRFFRILKEKGAAVHFRDPPEKNIPAWIRKTAGGMGLEMDGDACACLMEIVGAELMELHSEIEKLAIRFQGRPVGVEEVRESAVSSRSYTIFELMDAVSSRRLDVALPALRRFLEEEDRDGPLRVLGMISREVGLLWRCKRVSESCRDAREVSKKLEIHAFVAQKILPRSKLWSNEELEKGVHLLHRADGRIKSGAGSGQVLEWLLITLCGGGSL